MKPNEYDYKIFSISRFKTCHNVLIIRFTPVQITVTGVFFQKGILPPLVRHDIILEKV